VEIPPILKLYWKNKFQMTSHYNLYIMNSCTITLFTTYISCVCDDLECEWVVIIWFL